MLRLSRRLGIGLLLIVPSSIGISYKYNYYKIYNNYFNTESQNVWQHEKKCFKAFCYSLITKPSMFLLFSAEAQYTIIDHIIRLFTNINNDDEFIEKLFDFNVINNSIDIIDASKIRNCRSELVKAIDIIASYHEQYCQRILKLIGWKLLLSSFVKYGRIESPLFDSQMLITTLLDDPIIPVNIQAQRNAEMSEAKTYDLLVPLLNKLTYVPSNTEATQHLDETQRILDQWSNSDESLNTSSDDLAQIIHLLTKTSTKDPDEEPPDFHYHSLRALASLCTHEINAGLVIDENGLYLLSAFCERYKNDERIKTQTARTIANLARSKKQLTEIIRYNFLRRLIRWSRSKTNIKLHLQAIRALSNLRYASSNEVMPWYHDELYILYSSNDPLHDISCIDPINHIPWRKIVGEYLKNLFKIKNTSSSNTSDNSLNIIFVHGLMGSPLNTWRTQQLSQTEIPVFYRFPGAVLWPKYWLPLDINFDGNVTILSVGYHSLLSSWSGTSIPLHQRSIRTLLKLQKAGIGIDPNQDIIFVAHSMGGLLVKHMLKDSIENKKFINFKNNTSGVCFYATPHFGSPLTELSKYIGVLFRPSFEVNDLKVNAPLLIDLNKSFAQLKNIRKLSFGENEEISYAHIVGELSESLQDLPIGGSMLLVPLSSSNPQQGIFIPMNKNHFDICKPTSRTDPVYSELVALINNTKLQRKSKEVSHEV